MQIDTSLLKNEQNAEPTPQLCHDDLLNNDNEQSNEQSDKNSNKTPNRKIIIIGVAALCLIMVIICIVLSTTTCVFGHNFSKATCEQRPTCERCGETSGKKLPHEWDGETTCEHMAVCSNCGKQKDEKLAEHKPKDKTTIKEATCQDAGQARAVCEVCGKNLTITYDKGEHKYNANPIRHVEFYITKEGNIQPGIDILKCELCGQEKEQEKKPDITTEQSNCIDQAVSYLRSGNFSKNGLVDQLEYEKYPTDIARWTVDHLQIDWNEQAYESAKHYLKTSAFSYQGLFDQLVSEYGADFAREEVEYAMAKIDAETDWDEQAYKSAQHYLKSSSFSKERLISQLESAYGAQFTHDQAVYGANKAYDE